MSKVVAFFVFCLTLLCSCEGGKESKMDKMVGNWRGKAIAFPAHSTFTIQCNDTVDFAFPDFDYRIVTYIDSIGCASENFELTHWSEFMNEMDSLTDGDVHFVFYFNSKDKQKLRYITLRDNFTYPICFDDKGLFDGLNQFSKEFPIQSFLLDTEDKVLTVGDPINNNKTKELYCKIMTRESK